MSVRDLMTPSEITWCPGCGNFGILTAVRRVLVELGLSREEVVAVTGIGCHGKFTNYINVNGIHVIHGRVLPVATAIKLANEDLTVIGFAGDGDAFNIGIGHFPHAARRNPDITYVIHDNLIYGLTTGQASATTTKGHVTKTSPRGLFEDAVNPIVQALAGGASFVARGFVGELEQLTSILKEAISFPGFALVDVLQPCVAWNRINTYDFYRERAYKLEEEGHDASDQMAAYERAMEWGNRIPIGVFYRKERPVYRENFPVLKAGPMARQCLEGIDILRLLEKFR